jgi:hypothetical protein
MMFAFMALLAGISATSAQEQEGKLVDRILKPNMSLVNSAQNEKFDAAGNSVAKHALSKSFCTLDKSFAKSFPAARTFSPPQFAAHDFRGGDAIANASARSQLMKTGTIDVAAASDGTHVAPENAKNLPMASFAGNRPFLGRGKSQKALSAQDRPLTIEKVRELLNKNK